MISMLKLKHLLTGRSFNVLRFYSRQITCSQVTISPSTSVIRPTFTLHDVISCPQTSILQQPSCLVQQIRGKKRAAFRNKQKAKKKAVEDEEEEDTDDEDEDDSDEEEREKIGAEFDEHFDGDRAFPSNYKEERLHLKSARADRVAAKALGQTLPSLQDNFVGGKVLINGEKASKKSVVVHDGDYIDVLSGFDEEGQRKRKRVRVVQVMLGTHKDVVSVRTWKSPVVIPEE